MHDLHREHPHPHRPRLTGVSLATEEFDEQCEDDFGLCLELGGELLEPEQEEDNTGAAEGKRESGAWRAFRGAGGKCVVVIRLRAQDAVNMKVIRGQLLTYRVSDG
jgi:hypothetical protein